MQSRALTTPQADFWLLGGLSIVILTAVWILTTWIKPEWSLDIVRVAVLASFIVNYPHFSYSYQLFYKDFYNYLRGSEAQPANKARLFVAGILVPVLLIGFFMLVGVTHNILLMSYSLSAYMFLSMWHYVKQGYGALITMSVYKKIFYSNWQKRILYGNAYVLWIYAWVKFNPYITRLFPFYDTQAVVFHFPAWVLLTCQTAACIGSLLAAAVIFYVWKIEKKGITFNGIMGYVAACYIWVVLLSNSTPVLIACVPFFHSLQYMPFVYKFKKNELEDERKSCSDELKSSNITTQVLLWAFICTGIVLGAMFFDAIPKLIDSKHGPWGAGFTNYFFLLTFVIFINIHHFFIDHSFWRKENPKIQKFLFNA